VFSGVVRFRLGGPLLVVWRFFVRFEVWMGKELAVERRPASVRGGVFVGDHSAIGVIPNPVESWDNVLRTQRHWHASILFVRYQLTFFAVPKNFEGAILLRGVTDLPIVRGIRYAQTDFPNVALVVDVHQELGMKATLMSVNY
jgi:hypothetical protein